MKNTIRPQSGEFDTAMRLIFLLVHVSIKISFSTILKRENI